MRARGFTVLEVLIAVVVISVIFLIALPINAVRVKRSEEAGMRSQLMCIKEAEEKYRSLNGTYTTDGTKLAGWKERTGKYHYRISHADPSQFIAEATLARRNKGSGEDVWAIDQGGIPARIK